MLASAAEDFRELSADTLTKRTKFAELIIKCVWKITKALPDSLAEELVEPSQLLLSVEKVFKVVPPAEWKARAADGIPMADVPLRTLKVILTHVHQAYGEDVFSHLDLISEPEKSHVYTYLVRLVNSQDNGSLEDVEDSPQKAAAAKSPVGSPSVHASPSGSRLDDDPASVEIRDIFDRISKKDASRDAIRDLYEFQKRYPHKQGMIQRSLEQTGPIFQRYIKRALANHAAEDEGIADAPEGEHFIS